MTTGIIILGITAVLLFFGAAERYFDRLGMTSWLAFFLLTGFIGGAAAYAIAGSRLGCVAAIFGGCIVGDAASMGLLSGAYGFSPFTLGGYGIFNAMIVGCAASLLTAEIVCAVRRSIENRSVAARRLEAEAAEDVGAETKREEPGCDADDNDIYGWD